MGIPKKTRLEMKITGGVLRKRKSINEEDRK